MNTFSPHHNPVASRRHRLAQLLTLGGALVLPLAPPALAEVFTQTLNFETQGFDLDTGAVIELDDPTATTTADISLAYNARRTTHAVLRPATDSGVAVAYVADMGFDGVTADSLAGLSLSPQAVDLPFSADHTVVVQTSTGAVFKLGNALENGESVTFTFSQIQ